MSSNNITDEFREKWISKIYTTHFETMPEAVRWIRENITDDMEASIHLYKLATENLKEAIEALKAENSKMRKALEKSLERIADIKQKDIPLDDKKGMALYHIKWLATEALK